MDEQHDKQQQGDSGNDLRGVIREVIQEFVTADQRKSEPAYKTELVEERRRREQLEKRVNELVQENSRSRRQAEEAEMHTAIREGLQRIGVAKVDLGFRVVKDDIFRAEDGRLMAKTSQGAIEMDEFLSQFASENPELLPARISGGSGAVWQDQPSYGGGVNVDRIRPGMDPEELALARREIAQAVSRSFRR